MEQQHQTTTPSSLPQTQLELSVSARNLADKDVFSKSDPVCVLFTQQQATRHWQEYDRTETIDDTLNPDFVKKFHIGFFFEEVQKLRFELYDIDDRKNPKLSKQEFLGSCECTLAEIVAASGTFEIQLQPKGILRVRPEEIIACKEVVKLQFRGLKLDKKDFLGKSDPFLAFHRINEDLTWTLSHKTEVIKNTLNPTWAAFELPMRVLNGGDLHRAIKVECWDWNKSGDHELIGEFQTNMNDLNRGRSPENLFPLTNEAIRKKKGSKYRDSGRVELLECQMRLEHSFVDYVRGGTELACTVAVDFTGSNGDPRSPTSLHFLDPARPNSYQLALRAVLEILKDYDSDQLFPALGFGARLPPDGRVSHNFFLNGDASNPYCQGVEGVMQAYRRALNTVQLYGPTNFAPIINHVADMASTKLDGTVYHILMIITDGIITDFPQTAAAVVRASNLPVSIIIVGVGEADFEAMNVLDGDDVRLSSQGRTAVRDIVQFVPFRDFHDQRFQISQSQLAREVLAEIPDQFLTFMKMAKIQPGRRASVASSGGAPPPTREPPPPYPGGPPMAAPRPANRTHQPSAPVF